LLLIIICGEKFNNKILYFIDIIFIDYSSLRRSIKLPLSLHIKELCCRCHSLHIKELCCRCHSPCTLKNSVVDATPCTLKNSVVDATLPAH
jgi:hypothetical protein